MTPECSEDTGWLASPGATATLAPATLAVLLNGGTLRWVRTSGAT
jgi:hypothetical protein